MDPRTPNLAPYFDAWKARLASQRTERSERAARRSETARRILPSLARCLSERFNVLRVYLIGSLARGDFGCDSDIDLVVEGLGETDLFRAGSELEKLAGEIPVDLVPLESATQRLRDALAREGVRIDGG